MYIRQLLIYKLSYAIQRPGSTRSSSYPSLSRPPISSSLKFRIRSIAYAAPALWNGLPKDLRQFAHPPNPPLNFPPTSTLLCYIPLTTEDRTLSYPISILLLRHHTSTIITDCNRISILSPRLDL